MFSVLATDGNLHLAGENIDDILVDFCLSKIKTPVNERNKRRLKTACESAKRTLSTTTITTIEVESMLDGEDFSLRLSRAKFEELCSNIFQDILKPLDLLFKNAKMRKEEVDEVVLVGGTTRIPKIQDMISSYFNNKQLNKSLNVDESVAIGAAIQGAILSGNQDEKIKDLLLIDVTPLSYCIKTAGDIATVIVPRNTTIPTIKTMVFSNSVDNQKIASIEVYEGERQFVKDNTKLGQFDLEIPPAPRGSLQIEVSYTIDANSILHVSAKEKSTNKMKDLTIKHDKNKLTKEQIEEMIQEAEKFKEDDKRIRELIETRNDLENYVYSLKSTNINKLNQEEQEIFNQTMETSILFLEENNTKEQLDNKRKEIEQIMLPLLKKIYSEIETNSNI